MAVIVGFLVGLGLPRSSMHLRALRQPSALGDERGSGSALLPGRNNRERRRKRDPQRWVVGLAKRSLAQWYVRLSSGNFL